MPKILTLATLRDRIENTIGDVVSWFAAKPRLFAAAHPEQQIQFELAVRLRERLRAETNNLLWDRLLFDGTGGLPLPFAAPPILIDTRQLFGITEKKARLATEPDAALAVHVLRTVDKALEFDDDANPVGRRFFPLGIQAQGVYLEQRVAQLERLSHRSCDGTLLVVYSNEARRQSVVDLREVASWAAWQKPLDTLWWTVRHFRAKAVR